MKTAHRIASLLGVAILTGTSVTALAAAPAAAAGYCTRGDTITKSWGKLTYARCYDGDLIGVQGKLTDLEDDECRVRADFRFYKSGDDHYVYYETMSSKSFTTWAADATSVTGGLTFRCV
ncbi:hypothetical protein ACIBAG_10570 [Streptomyces sp. NPDC051243]|uniref:hypothetical protein n=1 Tax=Streptomyces sp. NPDC051243 TaxID=3365646 RepID=UPI003788F465